MYELHFMLLLINNLERKKVGKKNNKKQKIIMSRGKLQTQPELIFHFVYKYYNKMKNKLTNY